MAELHIRKGPHWIPDTENWKAEVLSEGVSGVGSLIAGVLAIIGLAGLAPVYMASIAAIVLGVSLIMSGIAITAEYRRLIISSAGEKFEALSAGLTLELLGGIAVLVLGILALIGVAPLVLLAVAAITLGVVLIFSRSTISRLNDIQIEGFELEESAYRFARAVVASSLDTQVVVGGAVAILGIVSVIGIHVIGIPSLLLSLIAFLAAGAVLAFSGAALAGRMHEVNNEIAEEARSRSQWSQTKAGGGL